MKDEWDFDDDDEEDELNWNEDDSSSPKKPSPSSSKKSSPESLLSSSSSLKSKTSSSSSSNGIAAYFSRGRKQSGSSTASSPSSASASTTQISRNRNPQGQLRTRAARLSAQGVKVNNQSRKVRFELSSSSVVDASSSLASTATASSYRSLADSHGSRKQRRRKRQIIEPKEEEEEDDDDEESALAEKKNAPKPSAPSVSLQTTSVDVYAVQDIAKIQRLTDELKYCCDTLQSSRKAPRQLEAVADLSQMLSNRRDRQCLLFAHHSQGNDGDEVTPLAIILNLMEWLHGKMGCSVVMVEPQTTGMPRTKSSRLAETNSPRTPVVQDGLPPSVVEGMGVVWHFLSTDCTMGADSSSQTSSAARKLRESFLSNGHVMQTLLEMVVNDPYLDPGIGGAFGNEKDAPASAFKMKNFSQESSSSTLSSRSPPGSPDSFSSTDPTVAGRWRKRRRKMILSGQALKSIPENETKKKLKLENWSYSSESSAFKAHDDGSVASSASHATDTQAQFEKVLDIVKETVETLETQLHHDCGNEKNEIFARLPLLSLCRIISGKFEGEEKSCIDDDPGDAGPDNDEDEMSRNPLLRTNVMIAENGLIPFLARATSKAALAVVEQLTNRDACSGCESYIRWKFCKLTSLVDEACLLTDGNREAFVTEGFTSETGGYLLINLATTLMVLLEKGKLFDECGWLEVGMAAFRSLTSLTHDNEAAARDLQASSIESNGMTRRKSFTVIVQILYEASTKDGDMANYCLNTLANVLEGGAAWEPFSKIKVGEDEEPFLQWLTKHIVSETRSFQDAVVGSSFGSARDRHAERQLDKKEYEALMMAGNALIFLSCILVRSSAKTSNKVNEEILAELPGEECASKLLFVKNTLKAFCNLCHFSMGPLALAIVAPVKKLLSDLEDIYGKE